MDTYVLWFEDGLWKVFDSITLLMVAAFKMESEALKYIDENYED